MSLKTKILKDMRFHFNSIIPQFFKLFCCILCFLISCQEEESIQKSTRPTENTDNAPDEDLIDYASVPGVYSTSNYEVKETKGIEYAQALSHANLTNVFTDSWNNESKETISMTLDIYEPDDDNSVNRPAILIYNGGAFSVGDSEKPTNVATARHFASRGWVAFSVNYRLLKERGTIPEEWIDYYKENGGDYGYFKFYPAIRDAKASVRWLYANANNYSVNTNYITVAGGSAGSFISLALGITGPGDYTDEISLENDPTLLTTNLNQKSEVHTIIDLWGGLGCISMLDYIYSIDAFDANDPPVLIVHGEDDTTVPISDSESLVERYNTLGIYNEFYPLEGEGHSPWGSKIDGKSLDQLSCEFVIDRQDLTQLD